MKVLIAYFTRTGVTRQVAEVLRETLSASDTEEVVSTEIVDRRNWSGPVGFIRALWASLRRKATTIEPLPVRVEDFDLVVVGTPVWADSVTPAARTFCAGQGRKARRIALFCTMRSSGAEKTLATLAQLCEKEPAATLALTTRQVKDLARKREGEAADRLRRFVETLTE